MTRSSFQVFLFRVVGLLTTSNKKPCNNVCVKFMLVVENILITYYLKTDLDKRIGMESECHQIEEREQRSVVVTSTNQRGSKQNNDK